MRVVAPDGSQIGVKTIDEARWLASQLGMDLVEVAPDARPPVCRLMDYGKYKYEQSVRQREARTKQTRTVVKEVKFRPKTDDHDYEWKKRRVLEFLDEGDKVKVTLMFRGRELSHPELGERILRRLAEDVAGFGGVAFMTSAVFELFLSRSIFELVFLMGLYPSYYLSTFV